MDTTSSYRKLIAWQLAMKLCVQVYKLISDLPKDEKYGLSSQIKRAAVSIPSNIAEGHNRMGKKEFLHHLSIARGSLGELETQLLLGKELEFITEEKLLPVWDICQELGRVLTGLVKSLR
jgi:four helix bundle protein